MEPSAEKKKIEEEEKPEDVSVLRLVLSVDLVTAH